MCDKCKSCGLLRFNSGDPVPQKFGKWVHHHLACNAIRDLRVEINELKEDNKRAWAIVHLHESPTPNHPE